MRNFRNFRNLETRDSACKASLWNG